jgi:hypothetical protein
VAACDAAAAGGARRRPARAAAGEQPPAMQRSQQQASTPAERLLMRQETPQQRASLWVLSLLLLEAAPALEPAAGPLPALPGDGGVKGRAVDDFCVGMPADLMELAPIPRRLIFTFKHDILRAKAPRHFYDNVQATVAAYRAHWGEPDAPVVEFLDDAACRVALQDTEPRLVRHFDSEPRGAYRGDLCRLAALYLRGGFYFDVDLKTLQPVPVGRCTRFVTPLQPNGLQFHQAFVAAAAGHPLLRLNFGLMLDVYEGRRAVTGELGPETMRLAYDTWQVCGSRTRLPQMPARVSAEHKRQTD